MLAGQLPKMGRKTLRQGLDHDILQAVRKYQDSQPGAENGPVPSEQTIYAFVQRSNSSLRRKPKQVLEASIQRVLDVLRQDIDESDGLDIPEIDDFLDSDHSHQSTSNAMNKALRAGLSSEPEKPHRREKERLPNGEPARKKRKPEKAIETAPPTKFMLEDIGGVKDIIRQLMNHLTIPLLEPETYLNANIEIPRGVLLHGPPGCGKTVLCRAIAATLGVPFVEILGPSVVSGMSGESEQKIRERFEEAKKVAPCLLFIDEIDVIAPKRDSAQSQMEKRIVAQLLISMDGAAAENNDGKPVIILGATNRPDSIDPALRRGGRFGTEINMGVPNELTRRKILEAQTRKVLLGDDVDFTKLAKMTSGFVGADLRDLVSKAGEWSMERYQDARKRQLYEEDAAMDVDDRYRRETTPKEIASWARLIRTLKDKTLPKPEGFETLKITMEAFLVAFPTITPSSKREGFATVPDTTWEDIGALHDIRRALEMAVVQPIKDPERFRRLGILQPSGVLLWGPPGCGKTLLAKAVARESKANFISVKGAELLNKVTSDLHLEVISRLTHSISTLESQSELSDKSLQELGRLFRVSSSLMSLTPWCQSEQTLHTKRRYEWSLHC